MLRKAGYSNIKVVVVFVSDVPNQIDAVHETALNGLPFFLSHWRITSEGKDVPTAMLLGFLRGKIGFEQTREKGVSYPECIVYFFFGHVGACEMHTCLNANKPLACFYHLRCEVGCSA